MARLFRPTTYLTAILGAWTLTLGAHAHSGRTNAEGCHNNRSNGTYHCHSTNRPSSTPPASPGSDSDAWAVVSVGDGDTIRVRRGNETVTVRLACIDAPEMAQPTYGELAKGRLQSLLPISSSITLRPINTDRYDRLVAEVFQQDANINLALVESGHAVVYRQYLSNCDATDYLNAEATAQQNGLVFWAQSNPMMPWNFRRQ
ncbi:MAG: thermonuclease family protein [Cyanobacteria bacterium J06555_13]